LLLKAHVANVEVGCSTCPGHEATGADQARPEAPMFLIAAE